MKKLLMCLAALVFAVNLIGCSQELSEAELKKAEEEMKVEMEKMSEELPAKLQ